MNPNDFDAHFIRGNLYLNVNKSSEAIIDYKRAIEIKPESFQVYFNRGCVYGNRGKYR